MDVVWHSEALLCTSVESALHFSYQVLVFGISLGSSVEFSCLFVTICSCMESAFSPRTAILTAGVSFWFWRLQFQHPCHACPFWLFKLHFLPSSMFSYSQVWWTRLRSSSKLAVADMDQCRKRGNASVYCDQVAGFVQPCPWTMDQPFSHFLCFFLTFTKNSLCIKCKAFPSMLIF